MNWYFYTVIVYPLLELVLYLQAGAAIFGFAQFGDLRPFKLIASKFLRLKEVA